MQAEVEEARRQFRPAAEGVQDAAQPGRVPRQQARELLESAAAVQDHRQVEVAGEVELRA